MRTSTWKVLACTSALLLACGGTDGSRYAGGDPAVAPTDGSTPGAATPGSGSTPPTVAVVPDQATVAPGTVLQLTANVPNGSTVVWSIEEGAAGGSVTSSGLYTAPAKAGTYTVVATVDRTSFGADVLTTSNGLANGRSKVKVTPPISVTVSPANVSLTTGAAATFSAAVANSTNQAVTWSVQEGTTGGAITSAGVYTAPSSAGTYHVVATSVADTKASATSSVTVGAPPPPSPAVAVTVSPSTASVTTGGTASFTATVANSTNQAVTWSVQEGTAGGAITSAGVYSAPSAVGTYHVVATSQADAARSATAAITVTTPVGTGSRFPLAVHSSGRYLVDAQGNPFRIHGDSAWSYVANLSAADQTTYVTDRAAKGFNTLLTSLFEKKFSQHAPNLKDGTAPFATPGNFATINQTYLDFAAAAVDRAGAQNILVLLDVMYLGYGGAGTSEGWYDSVAGASASDMTTLGTAIGYTFRSRPNVIFVIGGDYTLTGAGSDPTVSSRLETLRSAIVAAGATQPWTAHWGPGSDSSAVAAFASLIAIRGAYDNRSEDAAGTISRAAYGNSTVKPSFFCEGKYENEYQSNAISREGVRSEQWQGFLGAIGGTMFGSNPIWHFNAASAAGFESSTVFPYDSWQHALGANGSLDFQRMGAFLDSLEWWKLAPENVGSGPEFFSGGTAGAIDRAGSLALVFIRSTGTSNQSITIDKSKMGGAFRARWWNPTDGTFMGIGTGIANTGSATFTSPGDNGTGTNDWVLVVDVAP